MKPMRIDFVSDVVCPWCIIGLKSLEQALANAADVVEAEIHFQPFELNPDMPREGQNVAEHIAAKYGADPERSNATRDLMRTNAANLGFAMNTNRESRIWNTFDCHRLLHWAGLQGRQAELKLALFTTHFSEGNNLGDSETLVAAAVSAGLDGNAAREVLESGAYVNEVRQDEKFWREQGITAVPAIIIDRKYLISGGQPVAAFEKAIRSIAAREIWCPLFAITCKGFAEISGAGRQFLFMVGISKCRLITIIGRRPDLRLHRRQRARRAILGDVPRIFGDMRHQSIVIQHCVDDAQPLGFSTIKPPCRI